MALPGIGVALLLGVALGTAIYLLFVKEEEPVHRPMRRTPTEHNNCGSNYDTNSLPGITARTDQCSICLDTMGSSLNNSKITNLSCGHNYHNYCITMWLRTNRTCPLCRRHAHTS